MRTHPQSGVNVRRPNVSIFCNGKLKIPASKRKMEREQRGDNFGKKKMGGETVRKMQHKNASKLITIQRI